MSVEGFPKTVPIYVVSLRRAVERRRKIAEQLDAHGLDYVFSDAFDAAELDPEFLRSQADEKAIKRNLGRPMSGPEIGCALTHRQIYRDISDSGCFGGLVLEDDATITPLFLEALAYFREAGPEMANECSIFHLEALSRYYARDVVLRRRAALRVSSRLKFRQQLGRLSTELWGTCGYYVTRAAAASLLAQPRIDTVADHWSLWARRSSGEIYVAVPPVVVHPADLSDSEIEAFRLAARNPSTGRSLSSSVGRLLDRSGDGLLRYLVRPIAEFVM